MFLKNEQSSVTERRKMITEFSKSAKFDVPRGMGIWLLFSCFCFSCHVHMRVVNMLLWKLIKRSLPILTSNHQIVQIILFFTRKTGKAKSYLTIAFKMWPKFIKMLPITDFNGNCPLNARKLYSIVSVKPKYKWILGARECFYESQKKLKLHFYLPFCSHSGHSAKTPCICSLSNQESGREKIILN